jgi:hypothetical protein
MYRFIPCFIALMIQLKALSAFPNPNGRFWARNPKERSLRG